MVNVAEYSTAFTDDDPPVTRGYYELILNSWWLCRGGKPLVYKGRSPQCNSNEQIARALQERTYPEAQVLFFPRVWVKIDPYDWQR